MSGHAATPIALGFRAVRGGGVAVGVAVDAGAPRVVLSRFLATSTEGDRLAFEPYHVAYEMPRGADGDVSAEAAAIVAEGRRRQQQQATAGLAGITETLLGAGREPVVAVLLINRAGWMNDLLQHALSAPEPPPVHEGLAVRDALRFAFAGAGLRVVELDEKTLPSVAATQLRLSTSEIDPRLADLGRAAGRPWRKEQKLACLAAWLAAAAL
jgi:hypothetical protein